MKYPIHYTNLSTSTTQKLFWISQTHQYSFLRPSYDEPLAYLQADTSSYASLHMYELKLQKNIETHFIPIQSIQKIERIHYKLMLPFLGGGIIAFFSGLALVSYQIDIWTGLTLFLTATLYMFRGWMGDPFLRIELKYGHLPIRMRVKKSILDVDTFIENVQIRRKAFHYPELST